MSLKFAQLAGAVQARSASTAGQDAEGDVVAGCHVLHGGAYRFDDAGALMAEDDR
ncbi:hypothetical protein Vlu01_48620 [Micromonospora lutea]|uniref:Uncharacterized protein n=1 Tax=Micromonospora lutea TaxID=419825 RepID=A0ABQ4J214_9ACTN|nr:hypothetical protein Vlu01_48620 [Micromonospora lutea]